MGLCCSIFSVVFCRSLFVLSLVFSWIVSFSLPLSNFTYHMSLQVHFFARIRVGYPFSFLSCFLCPILPISVVCSFVVASSVFSYAYLKAISKMVDAGEFKKIVTMFFSLNI